MNDATNHRVIPAERSASRNPDWFGVRTAAYLNDSLDSRFRGNDVINAPGTVTQTKRFAWSE